MQTKIRFSIISAGGLIAALAVLPATPAAAIEPPPEEATPPAELLQEGAPRRGDSEASPFMGVATAEVPEMLADHLGLSDRTGVIIRTVCPDSPAEKAGLSVNDIITGLDGKPIANPDALSAAIRDRKAGERLRIDLIHKGKPANIELTLTDRPADATAQRETEPYLEGIPKAQADRLRGLIEQNLGAFSPGDLGTFRDGQFDETFRQMRNRMNRAFGDDTAPGAGQGIRFQQNSTIRLMDGDGSVEINASKGDTQVKVRDKGNKIVWFGPWNTQEDKAAAPDDIRERIDRVKAGNGTGFSFRFGKSRSNPDTIDN
jgi:serine protease Do